MKKVTFHLLLALFLLTLIPREALCQNQRQVARALQRLNRRLEFARDVILSFENEKAKALLVRAVALRNQAENNLKARKNLMAMKAIQRANELINRALQIALRNPVERMRERLEELLRYAENVVLGSGNKEAERLLREAKENQRQAIEAFKTKRFRKAMEHYRIAVFLAEKSINLVEKKDKNLRERLNEERQRFEDLLQKAREAVERSGNKNARNVLNQAMKQAQKTKQAFDNQNFKLAITFYYRATRLLLRALDLAEGGVDKLKDRALDEVTALDELIESAQERILESKNERALFLLNQAVELQKKAWRELDTEQYQKVFQKTDLARSLIGRALRIVDSGTPSMEQRIEKEISRLEHDLKGIGSRVEKSRSKEAMQLFQLAVSNEKMAKQAFIHGNFRLALERVLTANRLSFAAERLICGELPPGLTTEKVTRKLKGLEKRLSEAERKVEISGNKLAMNFVSQAQEMKKAAEKALQENYLTSANEYIELALDLVQKSLRLIP